jgi:hypothetical protein
MAREAPPESLGHGKVTKATDKALEIELTDLGETRWIPRSILHANSEVYDDENREGEVVVQQWWALQEGLV